jgi:parallel beta-helix repeat protein
MKTFLSITPLVIAVVLLQTLAYGADPPSRLDVCYCSSCGECQTHLDDPVCDVVKLTADIFDHAGTCVQDFDGKAFDCQGHVVDGTGDGCGVRLSASDPGVGNNTISNCTFTGFDRGICLTSSSGNKILNNTVTASDLEGIVVSGSSNNNIISDNNVYENPKDGILIDQSSYNTVKGNTLQANGPGIGLVGASYNYVLGNVANNNTGSGSGACPNCGISLYQSSSYNFIYGNTTSYNE